MQNILSVRYKCTQSAATLYLVRLCYYGRMPQKFIDMRFWKRVHVIEMFFFCSNDTTTQKNVYVFYVLALLAAGSFSSLPSLTVASLASSPSAIFSVSACNF